MITQLIGRLIEKTPTKVVIDCNGVGYEVNISLHTYSQIGDEEKIKLIKSKNIKNLELFFKEHNCKAVIVRPDRFILSSCTSVKNFNSYLNKNLSLLA